MARKRLIKPYEFWHPRLFELPYYFYLLWRCLVRWLPPKSLAKANYALDHGEIGIGSKYRTQLAFPTAPFLPTTLLPAEASLAEKQDIANALIEGAGYPLVLKPDIGSVGKGVVKISNASELAHCLPKLVGPYLLQAFTPFNVEYGVFYARLAGKSWITGINRKHFPTVVGNGRDNLRTLAINHERYTPHWEMFLKDLDTGLVPASGQSVQLSFIGSHTMGCRFTDDTHSLTTELARAIFRICDIQPGFNFGRLDIKAETDDHAKRGEFVVIEVNGVASLPTNMFDPDHSLRHAYRIFLAHGRYLVDIAAEHRDREMPLRSLREIIALVRKNHALLNEAHQRLIAR